LHRIRRTLLSDPGYYRSLLSIALPIALQALIGASLNLVDNVMVGGLGTEALAAVGLANTLYFVLNVALFGVTSGLSVFISQYWGRRDTAGIRRATGLAFLVSLGLSFAFFLAARIAPDFLMRLFTEDPAVVGLGADYLSAVSPAYPMMAVTMVFYSGLRSTERAGPPVVTATLGLSLNTILNYGLIYGALGMPALGVRGAAVATVVARAVECALILAYAYGSRAACAGSPRALFDLSRPFLKEAARVSLPVLLNESMWVLGTAMFPAVYARMGTDVIAAVNILQTVDRLAFVLAIGIGNAVTIMVGMQVGAGDNRRAFLHGARSLFIAPLATIPVALAQVALRPAILGFFSLTEASRADAFLLLLLGALVLPVRAYNMVNIVGILRGGGDTVFAMSMEILTLWGVAVPLAFAAGLWFRWPLLVVFLLSASDEFLKVLVGTPRFLSGKWIRAVRASGDAAGTKTATEAAPSG